MILSINRLYPKAQLRFSLFGHTQELTAHNSTEIYKVNEFSTPTIFDIKSTSSYRHLTLTHKKENLTRQIDVNDDFWVVEHDYTDEILPSSDQQLKEDYNKYSLIFPIDDRIKNQLISLGAGKCW